jgi:hypothetical protein
LPQHMVRLPAYPDVLLQPWRNDHTKEELDAILAALCEHYELSGPPSNELFAELALKLLRDFVPAFRKPKKPGRPRSHAVSENEIQAYRAAGGDGGRYMVESYIQACFVFQIRRLAKQEGSNPAAFAKLSGQMPAAIRLRAQLPERYRNLKTIGSLEDAWDGIPAFIRNYPGHCIPMPAKVISK